MLCHNCPQPPTPASTPPAAALTTATVRRPCATVRLNPVAEKHGSTDQTVLQHLLNRQILWPLTRTGSVQYCSVRPVVSAPPRSRRSPALAIASGRHRSLRGA